MSAIEDAARRVAPGVREGAGSPLLLVHGLAMSWRAWLPLLGPLVERYDVLAPTLPGHRGAPPAPREVRVSWFADYLETYLDEQGLDRVHVVGNSLGGWLALELARRDRALSVTAISPAGATLPPSDRRRMNAILRSANAMNRMPWTSAALAPTLRSRAGRRAVFRQLMERGDPMGAAEAAGLLRDAHACRVVPALVRAGRLDRFDPLPVPSCPVRVVWGRRDRVIPFARHGAPLMPLLPTADLVALDDAGHVPMHDAPDRLLDLVVRQAVGGEERAR